MSTELNKKYALFVGRWQPFHNGHKAIIDKMLNQGKNVLIGIRNTPINAENPFTVEERKKIIESVYENEIKSGRIKIIALPDIESINYSRGVGYDINEIKVMEGIKKISATRIRESMKNGSSDWIRFIPKNKEKGFVLWFTGLPQSGKTTIATSVYNILKEKGIRVQRLDGDILRKSISNDLGFSKEDRDENIKRAGLITQYLSNIGVNVICSFISPYRNQRESLRKKMENFIEIYCSCPLEVCEERDTKGLYRKARNGEIKNFTGISDPYEIPESPDITLETHKDDVGVCVSKIIDYLKFNKLIKESHEVS